VKREVVAQRYAEALLNAAAATTADTVGTDTADSVETPSTAGQADAVLAQILRYQKMGLSRRFLSNPRIPEHQKEAWIARIFDGPGGRLLRRFLNLLRRKGRIGDLDNIFHLYPVLYDAQRGIAKGRLTVAYPLETALFSKLQSRLEARIHKKLELSCTEDRSILGGFVFASGTLLMDASIRTQLTVLGERLKAAPLPLS